MSILNFPTKVRGAVYSADSPVSPSVGQIWIESDVDVDTYNPKSIVRWSKTLSGTESTFSGISDGVLLEYTPGFEQVYLNGIFLLDGVDYTATDGTSIILTSAAQSGDVVEVFCISATSIANIYTQAQVDSLVSSNSSDLEILNIMGAV